MSQEPDQQAEGSVSGDPPRPPSGDDPHLGSREGPPAPAGTIDPKVTRAGLIVVMFGYLALQSHWSWVVVGGAVAAMMLLPELGNWRLALLGGIVAFVGAVHGWAWVVIFVGVVVMIVLHELGHFLTARWSGMKATEFFVGFGPKLWSFHRGETEYGVKAIPAGAYVRIIGMTTAEEVPPQDEARTYRQQSFPKRLLVVSAGSLMHLGQAFVAAVVLLVVVGAPGGNLIPVNPETDDQWVVDGSIQAGSAADAAGLEEGDRIVEWDGEEVASFSDMRSKVEVAEVGEPVTLTVQRDGERFDVTTDLVDRLLMVYGGERRLDPGLVVVGEVDDDQAGEVVAWDGDEVETFADVQAKVEEAEVGDSVSLTVEGPDGESEIRTWLVNDSSLDVTEGQLSVVSGQSEVFPGVAVSGSLDEAGLVTAWDGEPVATYGELLVALGEATDGDIVPLTVREDGEGSYEVPVGLVDPSAGEADVRSTQSMSFLGIGPDLEDDRLEDQRLGLASGVVRAGRDTGELLWMTSEGVARFFSPGSLADFFGSAVNTGDDSGPAALDGLSPAMVGAGGDGDPREMMSIVGIVRLAANLDPAGLLMAFFLVNLTIGLINMAPLLPLDGGHAVVAIYERLRSRKGKRYYVDADKLMPLAYAGLMLILAIGLTAMFLDIVDPIEM